MGIKETFSKAYADIKVVTKNASYNIKTEYKKNKLKNELDEMYQTLGRIMFSEITPVTPICDEAQKIIAEINRLNAHIDKLNQKTNNGPICSVCGKNLTDGEFCAYCGAKNED